MTQAEKVLVILGTSRDESNTLKALYSDLPFKKFDLVELHKKKIQPYDYEHRHNDDFLKISQQMLDADIIVFATPVYWYSMSGTLKQFFDRLTELITTSKEIGRGLAHKKTYLLATGSDLEMPSGFEIPFQKTSEYFGMNYQQAFYKVF